MKYKITPFENYTIITLLDPNMLPSMLLQKTLHKIHNTPIYDLGSRFHLNTPNRFKTVHDDKLVEVDVALTIKEQSDAILCELLGSEDPSLSTTTKSKGDPQSHADPSTSQRQTDRN